MIQGTTSCASPTIAVKCFQAKLVCESPQQRAFLELTHRLFNESLRPLVPLLYAARKGRHGPDYQQILSTIKSGQGASAQVEAVSSLAARPGSRGGKEWTDLAKELVARGQILFDRHALMPNVHKEFRRKVFEMAFQIILSHDAKMKQWRTDHAKWLREKAEWERSYPEYLAVRPVIQEFEAREGQAGKRRGRWHRWLDFLVLYPQLAAWRGGEPTVRQLTQQELQEARRSRRRAVPNTIDAFFAKNPELKELHGLHGEYQARFVRPWAKRRHQDGFFLPPTFTLPSADRHPAWYSFKRGDTYRNLSLEQRTIELRVLKSADPNESGRHAYVQYQFVGDNRLGKLSPASKIVRSGRFPCDLLVWDEGSDHARPARVQGAKLVIRKGQAYLYFSVYIEDAPSRLPVKQAQIDKYSPGWSINRIRGEPYDPPLRTMAIDLGIRHIAAATVMENGNVLATRFLHSRPVSRVSGHVIEGIPTLPQISEMKQRLRRARRKFGKPLKGTMSCRRIQRHVTSMSEDRCKKSASAIVDFGRAHRVDIILMERLEGLVPDAARERRINCGLINWNRGHLASWIRIIAEPYGIRVLELPPRWTSQVCSHCGSIGARFTCTRGEMKISAGGKLFGCPTCAFEANADFNASLNLQRVFWGLFPQVSKAGRGRVQCNDRVIELASVNQAWENHWLRKHNSANDVF